MIMSVERNNSSNRGQTLGGLGSKGVSRRKPQHEIMQELSDDISKHNRRLAKEFKNVSTSMDTTSKNVKANAITNERIHDRLESLIYEQRATNMLLAKLVAMNESVLLDTNRATVENKAEQLRVETYNRVLQGD